MNKTLAQLKRDAKSGKVWMQCVEFYGRADAVPKRMSMPRKLVDANSVDIFFLTPEGDKSACSIRRASLIEYTDTGLTVFDFGYRDLTEAEHRLMDEWEKIEQSEEFQKRLEVDILSDGSSTYWQKKWFFSDNGMPWLYCSDGISKYGKEYDFSSRKVRDVNVRGVPVLKYVITKIEE